HGIKMFFHKRYTHRQTPAVFIFSYAYFLIIVFLSFNFNTQTDLYTRFSHLWTASVCIADIAVFLSDKNAV
ncbi:hypothetical protein, partial [Neisseria gonorrhoeae]